MAVKHPFFYHAARKFKKVKHRMDIQFIKNLAATTQIDGIYVFEQPAPGYIKGNGTGIVGIVGEFERGPEATKVAIGSGLQFRDTFGNYGAPVSGAESSWRGYSGYRAVAGKPWPEGLRIVRPANTSSAAATTNIDLTTQVGAGGKAAVVTAAYKGVYGNSMAVTIDTASDSTLTAGFSLTITIGTETQRVDNLFAGMTPTQLATALNAAGITLATVAINTEADTSKGTWPLTVTASGGANGTAGLAAWTAALDLLIADPAVNIIFYAEPPGDPVTYAALNAHIKTKLAPSTGAIPAKIAILAGPAADTAANAVTAVQTAALRSDRLIYTWPHRKASYPEASPLHKDGILTVPSSDIVACALAVLDPVYDPASIYGTTVINAATVGLEFQAITRDEYVTLNAKGILGLELDADLGYRVRNGITTSLVAGEESIHTRRLKDFLQLSVAASVKPYVNRSINRAWKDELRGAVENFFRTQQNLRPDPRILEFQIDDVTVNSPVTEAQGIWNILWRVRTPASARFLVFISQIGTNVAVTTTEQ